MSEAQVKTRRLLQEIRKQATSASAGVEGACSLLAGLLSTLSHGTTRIYKEYELSSTQRDELGRWIVGVCEAPLCRLSDDFLEIIVSFLPERDAYCAILSNPNIDKRVIDHYLEEAKKRGFLGKANKVLSRNPVLPLILLEYPGFMESLDEVKKHISPQTYYVRNLASVLQGYKDCKGTAFYNEDFDDEDEDDDHNESDYSVQEQEIDHPGLLSLFALLEDIASGGKIMIDRSSGNDIWHWRFKFDDGGWTTMGRVWTRITKYNDCVVSIPLETMIYQIDELDDRIATPKDLSDFIESMLVYSQYDGTDQY